jgi:nuclear pore complex protein Nup155
VSHLAAVHAYIGVVDICLAAAAKRDPQGLALHYYKNMEPADDVQVKKSGYISGRCISGRCVHLRIREFADQ